MDAETLRLQLAVPNAERIFYIGQAFQSGMSLEEIYGLTKIDHWFLRNVEQIVRETERLRDAAHWKSDSQPDLASAGPAAVNAADRMSARRTGRRPMFRGLDQHVDPQRSRRNLPQGEQQGATYFVTFRLADAVPAPLAAQWREELGTWRQFHPEPWDAETVAEYRRRFLQTREDWLDQGHGSCVLREPKFAQVVAESLRCFDDERYYLDAFVVMPNHVHALVQPLPGSSLKEIVRSWKSYTARQINKGLDRSGTLWMQESFDRIVRDWDSLVRCREYIARNPEKARLRGDQYVLCLNEKLCE